MPPILLFISFILIYIIIAISSLFKGYGHLDEIAALYGVNWVQPLTIVVFIDTLLGMVCEYG